MTIFFQNVHQSDLSLTMLKIILLITKKPRDETVSPPLNIPKKVKWYTWDSKIGSGIIVVYTWYFLNITPNKHISLLILWFLGGRRCPVICPTVIIYITNWHFWTVKISFIPLDCCFNSPHKQFKFFRLFFV